MRYFVMNCFGRTWVEVTKEVYAESGTSPVLTSNNATLDKNGRVLLVISESMSLSYLGELQNLMRKPSVLLD